MADSKYERYVQLFPKTFRPQDGDEVINNLPADETVGKTIAELWNSNVTNPIINAVLRGLSEGDSDIATALEETKAQLFVKTASGQFLDVIASSLGVSRPSALGLSDEAFRNVTPALSLRAKQVRQSFYAAMDAFWGTEFTRANISTEDQGGSVTFDISVGDTLSFNIDNRDTQNIPIRSNTEITSGAATALELNNLLNTSLEGITSEIITDPITKIDSIRIRTNTPGLRGSIQFLDNRDMTSVRRDLFTTTKTELINQTQRAVIYEINPNEVIIEIPAVVPTLARGLKGALHVHNGPLLNNLINNGETTNYILPDTLFLNNPDNLYTVTSGETWFTYDAITRIIALSPPPGQEPDVYEFNVTDDISGDTFRFFVRVIDRLNPPDNLDIWQGAFVFDPNGLESSFTLSGESALIQGDALTGQNQLAAGKVFPRVTVDPETNTLPDETGLAIIGFGTDTQESALIRYRGKASDSVILLDPSFIFSKTQPQDTYINIVSNASPFIPDRSGDAYPIYLTSSLQAREVIQGILETLAAAGVLVTFVIAAPEYKYLIDNPYLSDDGTPEN